MYGETCPVLAEVRPWFKDKSLEDMGRKYWKKKSYIFQGFVTDNPLKEETAPENPIRRFIIGPQIFQIIKQALMDPDMENIPTDYTAGTDFRLNKTSKGGYADYGTSAWARRERPLNDSEMQSIQKNGLFNLADFLPKKPTDIELKVISEMFEASVDGEAYDTDRWGQYFRPAGISSKTGDPVSNANANNIDPDDDIPVRVPTKVIPTKQEEPKTDSPKSAGPAAADILAIIKARQNKG